MSPKDFTDLLPIGQRLETLWMRSRTLRKRARTPDTSNRASEIGHPCVRYLTYRRRPEMREIPDTNDQLLSIFREGDLHERDVIARFLDIGVDWEGNQESFTLPRLNITGHGDGRIRDRDEKGDILVPAEIKSCSGNIFPRINDQKDLQLYAHTKKWNVQTMLYTVMTKARYFSEVRVTNYGLLILKSKQTGEIKAIRIDVDEAELNRAYGRAKSVNRALETGELPERTPWRECPKCPFFETCRPELVWKGAEVVENEDLEKMIEEKLENMAPKRRHDKRQKELSGFFKSFDPGVYIVGGYQVTVTKTKSGQSVKARSIVQRAEEPETDNE